MVETEILTKHEIKRIAMVVNPNASKGKVMEAAEDALETFVKGGVDVVQMSGATPEAGRELVHKAVHQDNYDALVVCGGDGLISMALQEQANTDMPMGIIPAGTGNDHAREYNISRHAARAAEIIMDGYATRTDLGIMRSDRGEERYFGTIACVGYDSLTSDRTNSIPYPTGRSRYVLAGVIEWARFQQRESNIYVDGELVFSGMVAMATIGNTRSYGCGMEVCPRADHHDGLLDLSLLTNFDRRKMLLNMGYVNAGTWWKLKDASMYRGKKIRIEMPGLTAYADGDPFFETPIECEVVPNAGYYIVPRP